MRDVTALDVRVCWAREPETADYYRMIRRKITGLNLEKRITEFLEALFEEHDLKADATPRVLTTK